MEKIRLARRGRKKVPHFKIVVANDKSPRDGKFIAEIGFYNAKSKQLDINMELMEKYISHGAQQTTTVNRLYKVFKKNQASTK